MHSKIPGGNELLNPENILKNELGLPYGAKVGNFGCGGVGYFTFQAAQIVGETGLVYAVDILKNVLKYIDHRAKMFGFKNIKTVWSNLENYGAAEVSDNSLDYGLLVNVLFQNQHPGKIFREISRMLRSGSRLLLIDWKEGRFPFGPPAKMRVRAEEIVEIALGAGFKKVKEFEAGRFHYGIIFEKI